MFIRGRGSKKEKEVRKHCQRAIERNKIVWSNTTEKVECRKYKKQEREKANHQRLATFNRTNEQESSWHEAAELFEQEAPRTQKRFRLLWYGDWIRSLTDLRKQEKVWEHDGYSQGGEQRQFASQLLSHE